MKRAVRRTIVALLPVLAPWTLGGESNRMLPLGGVEGASKAPGFADPEATYRKSVREAERRAHLFAVTVETVGGEVHRGQARFDDGEILYRNAKGEKKKVPLEEIRSVEYQKWAAAGRRDADAPVTFTCRRYLLELRNGRSLRVYDAVGTFDRFRLEPAGRGAKGRTLYGYFVDTLRQGKWVNTGGTKKSDPGEKPLPGVVRMIRFEED